MTPQSSVQDQMKRLREKVNRLCSDVDALCVLEAILEQGNAIDLAPTFNGTVAAGVLMRIRTSIVRDLSLGVARMTDRDGGDRASLPSVFAMLSKPDLAAALANEERIRIEAGGKNVDLLLARVIDDWNRFDSGPLAAGVVALRDVRNIHLAHSLNLPIVREPIFSELFGALRAGSEIVAQLGTITGCYLNGFDETRRIWAEFARTFWTGQLQIAFPKGARQDDED